MIDKADGTGRVKGLWTMRVKDAPATWKGIGQAGIAVLGEIAYALHRIAGALEGTSVETDEGEGSS